MIGLCPFYMIYQLYFKVMCNTEHLTVGCRDAVPLSLRPEAISMIYVPAFAT
jgi:hypothetical protein